MDPTLHSFPHLNGGHPGDPMTRGAIERMRSFIQKIPAPVCVLDLELRYLYASDRWVHDYGLHGIDIIGMSHYEVFPEILGIPRWLDVHRRCLKGASESCAEDMFQRADGRVEWVRWEIQPWYEDDGEIGGIVVFSEVITQRKQLQMERDNLLERERKARCEAERLYEEATRVNRIKDEFLMTLSHELRTPMAVIIGWIEILRDKKHDDPKMQRPLDILTRNANLELRLIEDMLDVSRIITGKLELDRAPTDVTKAVGDIVAAAQGAARAKGVHLVTDLAGVTIVQNVDEARLAQIAWNLVTNAIKFTPSGGTVTVSLGCHDEGMSIVVADTGEGIDPAFLPFIFDRFRQEEGSITRQHAGLGLGLAIVRHLTEMHGGTVSAVSPGKGCGATVTVTLPWTSVESKRQDISDFAADASPAEHVNQFLHDSEAFQEAGRTAFFESGMLERRSALR